MNLVDEAKIHLKVTFTLVFPNLRCRIMLKRLTRLLQRLTFIPDIFGLAEYAFGLPV